MAVDTITKTTESVTRDEARKANPRVHTALRNEIERRRQLAVSLLHRRDVRDHIAKIRTDAGISPKGFQPRSRESFAWLKKCSRIEQEGRERYIAEVVAFAGDQALAGCIKKAMAADNSNVNGNEVLPPYQFIEPTFHPIGPMQILQSGAEELCKLTGLDHTWAGWAQDLIQSGEQHSLREESLLPYDDFHHTSDNIVGAPYIVVYDEMTEDTLLQSFRVLRARQAAGKPEHTYSYEDVTAERTEDELLQWAKAEFAHERAHYREMRNVAPRISNRPTPRQVDQQEEARGLEEAIRRLYKQGEFGYASVAKTEAGKQWLALKGLKDASWQQQRDAMRGVVAKTNSKFHKHGV